MGYRGTLLFVSHDRALLNRLPTMVLFLDSGKLDAYKGNFDQFLDQREARLEQERAKSEQLRQRRESMEDFVRRFGAKASKAKQAQSRVKMIARIRELEDTIDTGNAQYDFAIALPNPPKSPRLVLEVENLSIGYQQPLAKGIECTIERGFKIAVIGANGIGKSTFLKTLTGALPELEGKLIPCPGLKIAYFSQDQSEVLVGNLSIIEKFMQQTGMGEKDSRSFLGGFMFRGDDVFKRVSVLSGGELSRLGLACAVSKKSGLLLLDEPTNHLDMATVEGLSAALDDYEGTMVFVSHDRTFIEGVCTHVLAMLPDGRSRLFPGKLADYELLAATSGFPNVLKVEVDNGAAHSFKKDKEPTGQSRQESKDTKAQRQKAERRQNQVDQEMTLIKSKLVKLEHAMAEVPPGQHQELRRIHEEQLGHQAKLQELENLWIELGEQIEKLTVPPPA
jgi:ATP-binding cassette subfamily F protein 3